jgi:branched-chain amino acid transport system ATP-binding protein
MSVLDNVLVGMHTRLNTSLADIFLATKGFHAREKAARGRAEELIELTGLRGRENEWAQQLSYGEQRRLEIARALAAAPQLLLLDEPTAGMNASEAQSLMRLFRDVMGRYVKAILLIEHNMRVVMGVSHRVHVLDYGEKIAEGLPTKCAEIRASSKLIWNRGLVEKCSKLTPSTFTTTRSTRSKACHLRSPRVSWLRCSAATAPAKPRR